MARDEVVLFLDGDGLYKLLNDVTEQQYGGFDIAAAQLGSVEKPEKLFKVTLSGNLLKHISRKVVTVGIKGYYGAKE